jgi:hypothetical protein
MSTLLSKSTLIPDEPDFTLMGIKGNNLIAPRVNQAGLCACAGLGDVAGGVCLVLGHQFWRTRRRSGGPFFRETFPAKGSKGSALFARKCVLAWGRNAQDRAAGCGEGLKEAPKSFNVMTLASSWAGRRWRASGRGSPMAIFSARPGRLLTKPVPAPRSPCLPGPPGPLRCASISRSPVLYHVIHDWLQKFPFQSLASLASPPSAFGWRSGLRTVDDESGSFPLDKKLILPRDRSRTGFPKICAVESVQIRQYDYSLSSNVYGIIG